VISREIVIYEGERICKKKRSLLPPPKKPLERNKCDILKHPIKAPISSGVKMVITDII
jgi:hypothetical protein